MNGDSHGTDFVKQLRREKLAALESRTTYTLKKLTYATTLLGLGSLEIDVTRVSALGSINLGLLLYLAPWVALAFDLYILAEDYSVKRFGAFLEKNSPDLLERRWEEWISENRDPFAPFAMPTLTTLILAGAALIIAAEGSAKGPFFVAWLITTPLVAWVLYASCQRLRKRIREDIDAVEDVDG